LGLSPPDAATLAGLDAPLETRHQPNSFADRHSMPDWLAETLQRELGSEQAERFAESINQRGPIALRANVLKTSRDALAARLRAEAVIARPGRLASTALIIESPARPNILG